MDIVALPSWLASRARKSTTVVDTVLLHATAGTSLSGALSALRNGELSYNYLIEDARHGHDGRITKSVAASRVAFHAGNSYGPHEEKRGVSRVQDRRKRFVAGCGVNEYTIGVSFVNANDGVDPYSKAQFDAARVLIVALKGQFPGLKWLTTHAIVSPGRKSDPRGFDVDRLASETGLAVWRYGS